MTTVKNIEFVVRINAYIMADSIDDALNLLGHHLLMPDDGAYQLLPNSKIDIHPKYKEGTIY